MNKDERAELRELVATHASAKGATEPYSMSPKWFADGPRVRTAPPDVDPDAIVGWFVRVRFAEYAVASINVARFAQPLLDALDAADARTAELETKLASFKPWPPPGVDFEQALTERLCSRCKERERDDPFYCDECSARLALEHEVDVHKARIAELEKLLATEASERETALAAEVARLKAIFDDAGQGEANVLGLIEHYQDRILELEKRVEELSAAEEEVVEMAPVEEGLSVLDCTQPSVESLRRRIRHQRREIRMLHRLREMESVSARRGREIALARMYDAGGPTACVHCAKGGT